LGNVLRTQYEWQFDRWKSTHVEAALQHFSIQVILLRKK